MLTVRYIARLIWAFLLRFRLVIFLGIFLGIIAFIFFRFVSPLIFGRNVERIGITGRYRPETLPLEILELPGDGLTKVDKSGIVYPNLAKSWSSPDNGKTWIFELRDDIVWQDGKKVTSKTIKYEFSDAEIETPDDKTIVFKLQTEFGAFPSVVARPTFKKGLLGTGGWEVKKISLAGTYIQELVLTDKNKDRKIFKFYPTEERTKLAYKLGEVNIIQDVIEPGPFDKWATADTSQEIDKDKIVSIFLNTNDKLLGEKSIRQALAYAIKKDTLGSLRAISPISPDSWAYNPQVKPYEYDPERSKELIADIPQELKENLNIKLTVSPVLLNVAEQIKKDWQTVGVNTEVQVSSGIPSEYQAFLVIVDLPKDPDQYALWHSTQTATNISHYGSPRVDKLLEDGRTEVDNDKRREIYLDFQRFLVEDSPAIFLYHPITYTISRR